MSQFLYKLYQDYIIRHVPYTSKMKSSDLVKIIIPSRNKYSQNESTLLDHSKEIRIWIVRIDKTPQYYVSMKSGGIENIGSNLFRVR